MMKVYSKNKRMTDSYEAIWSVSCELHGLIGLKKKLVV